MAKPLFDPSLVYPSDGVGPYIELEGAVLARGETDGDEPFFVLVETLRGQFRPFARAPFDRSVVVGGWARVRVYNSGGGWYPDDRITSAGPWPLRPEGGPAGVRRDG